jgi:hypothetical protein
MAANQYGTSGYILMRVFSCQLAQITRLDFGRYRLYLQKAQEVLFWTQTFLISSHSKLYLEDLENIIFSL